MPDKRRVPPLRPAGLALLAVVVTAILVVTAVLVGTARPASASLALTIAPSSTASPAQDLEEIIEEYDRVASLITTDQDRADLLGHTIRSLDKQVGHARAQLAPIVRREFEAGPVTTLRVLLDGASAAALTDQHGMAEAYAHHTRVQIASLTAARGKDAAAKRSLEATIVTLAHRRAELAAQKRIVLARLAALQDITEHVDSTDLTDRSPLRPVACPYTPIGGAAGIAVRAACAQIGKPYVWATAGPSTFDCSGLVVYAWAKAGVRLRHFTGFQWVDTTPISASELRPGDLVFFYPPSMHHVGIYVGGGWMVVAPHTGDVVRMQKIHSLPIGGYRRP